MITNQKSLYPPPLFYGILHSEACDGMSDFDKSEYWFGSAEYDLQATRAMLTAAVCGIHVPPDD